MYLFHCIHHCIGYDTFFCTNLLFQTEYTSKAIGTQPITNKQEHIQSDKHLLPVSRQYFVHLLLHHDDETNTLPASFGHEHQPETNSLGRYVQGQ